jgi:hypothetical protein
VSAGIFARRKTLAAMQDFPHHSYTSSINKAWPEIFPNVLDGVYPEGIDFVGLNQVVHPTVEGVDHMWVLCIEIRQSFSQPAYLLAVLHIHWGQTHIAPTVADLPNPWPGQKGDNLQANRMVRIAFLAGTLVPRKPQHDSLPEQVS